MKHYKKFKVRDGLDLRIVEIPIEIFDQWKGETFQDYREFFINNLDVFLRTMEADRQRRKRTKR